MGNNPQKNARQKQIQGYEVKVSDEEQSEKHLVTGNQFFYWEEFDRAKEFYLQSLRYNHKNLKSLTNLALVYKKQQKLYDAYICILSKTYIEQGYEDYIEEKIVNKQNTGGIISLATDNCADDSESLQTQTKQLELAKKYFLSNKALMDILPLMKDDFDFLIQQMKMNNKRFELMFFIEQFKEKFGELNDDNILQLLELYNQYGLYQKSLNVYLDKLKSSPNDKKILEQIIYLYERLNNNQKVTEYQNRLQSVNS